MSQAEHLGLRVRQAAARELRTIVERDQIPLAQLSVAAGIPRSTLYNKLHGNSGLTVAQLVQLAVALDIPAAELIERAVAVASPDGEGAPQER